MSGSKATSLNKPYQKGYDDGYAGREYNTSMVKGLPASLYQEGFDDGVTDREVMAFGQKEKEKQERDTAEYVNSKLCE